MSFCISLIFRYYVRILTQSHYQGATTVNVMVTLAAIQFIFIIIYHIITYLYNGVIRTKINYLTNTITTWISKLNKQSSNVDLQLHTIEIPEVTYNYREFHEPLIGQDLSIKLHRYLCKQLTWLLQFSTICAGKLMIIIDG